MINRDGFATSLWQASAIPYISRRFTTEENTFDVVIAGGGITGIATAVALQEAGKKCLVLEAANLCFGTTSGTTAHLNTLLDTPYSTIEKKFNKNDARLVAAAAAGALDLVRKNISTYSIDCDFNDAVAYLFAQDEKQEKELDEVVDASVRAGLEMRYESRLPFPIPFTKTAMAAKQAKFNPVKYVYGLAQAFESAGGTILQNCRVTDVKKGSPLEVITDKGTFFGNDIIYATHTPPGINLLHLRCAPWRTYAMAVELADGLYPDDLAYDMVDPYHYYRSQEVDGKTYLIAGGKDHKTGHEKNTIHLFNALEATIRENFRVKEVAFRWSSQYFESTDGLPYIGRLPGHDDHYYVATGFGGNGMTYSHVAANVLTTLLLGKENKLTTLLNPNRIKPVAGFTSFITHNTGVITNFAGKLFSADKITELSDLAHGEGRIVTYDGEKIGLYKDDSGNLHGINPVCTHMKCEVAWNTAEHSWDCPCHGARFNYDGKVITGPADRPLEMINLAELDVQSAK